MSPLTWGGGSTSTGGSITARNIIYDALRQLGAMRPGQGPSSDALDDYFRLLNNLVDAWNAERLMLRVSMRDETPTSAGQADYAFGPEPIEAAGYICTGSTEHELEILTPGQWAAIADKSAAGTPGSVFHDNGDTLTLHRVPDVAGTLVTYAVRTLEQFADLDTAYGFPAGYARALLYCLASDMAPAVVIHTKIPIQTVLLGSIERKAIEAKAIVKSRNIRPILLSCDPALLTARPFNIYSGR